MNQFTLFCQPCKIIGSEIRKLGVFVWLFLCLLLVFVVDVVGLLLFFPVGGGGGVDNDCMFGAKVRKRANKKERVIY